MVMLKSNASLSYSGKHMKTVLAVAHSAVKVVVKTLYGGDNFFVEFCNASDFPRTVSMNAIKI